MKDTFTYEELKEYAEIYHKAVSDDYSDRISAVHLCEPDNELHRELLDELKNDNITYVRQEVYKTGYALEEGIKSANLMDLEGVAWGCDPKNPEHEQIINRLIDIVHEYDENGVSEKTANLKVALAFKGYLSDELYKSENEYIRASVAMSGNHLEDLYKDPNADVRANVARACDINNPDHKKMLDALAQDDNILVLHAVIRKGNPEYIKALENHDDKAVREEVREYKISHPDWNKKQPDKGKETISKED